MRRDRQEERDLRHGPWPDETPEPPEPSSGSTQDAEKGQPVIPAPRTCTEWVAWRAIQHLPPERRLDAELAFLLRWGITHRRLPQASPAHLAALPAGVAR